MKKKKYYFARTNWLHLVFYVFICVIMLFSTSIKSVFFWVIPILSLFYIIIVHTSVTFYEQKVKFKVGTVMYIVNYDDVTSISETMWERPIGVGRGGNGNPYAHVFYIKGSKLVGLEHTFFTRDIALEIVETFKEMKKRNQELKMGENKQ